jgi:hypothetical protein
MVDLITSGTRVGHAIGFTWLPVVTHEGAYDALAR